MVTVRCRHLTPRPIGVTIYPRNTSGTGLPVEHGMAVRLARIRHHAEEFARPRGPVAPGTADRGRGALEGR